MSLLTVIFLVMQRALLVCVNLSSSPKLKNTHSKKLREIFCVDEFLRCEKTICASCQVLKSLVSISKAHLVCENSFKNEFCTKSRIQEIERKDEKRVIGTFSNSTKRNQGFHFDLIEPSHHLFQSIHH